MTSLTLPFQVFVDGDPAPKGSVSVNAGRRGVRHTKRSKSWHATVVDAIVRKLAMPAPDRFASSVTGEAAVHAGPPEPIATDVAVHAEFVIRKPAGNVDTSPTTLWCGDLDKLARSLLDALTGAKVIEDDSLVVELHVTKRWAGAVERCGVRILVTEPNGVLTARVLRQLAEERAECLDQLIENAPSVELTTPDAPDVLAAVQAMADELNRTPFGLQHRAMPEPWRSRADLTIPFRPDNEFG